MAEMEASMSRVGFIGLGSQGAPMALRIASAGFPLMVWARRRQVLAELEARGAVAADSVASLGANCDHVALCVRDDSGVFEVCEQLLPAMRPGSCLIVHSTVLPDSCVELAERCAVRSILFLDAPVSGGGPAAASGALTVMCGGAEATFLQARPILESFGKLIVRLGEVGAGQRAKIVNNALMAANLGVAHAALEAGEALGLSRSDLSNLLQHSSGRSFALDVAARLPSPKAFAHGADLLRKDVQLLRSVLEQSDQATMLHAAADTFLRLAVSESESCKT